MYQAKGRDCFYYILRRWKSIIALALIAAFLMCGLDVFKTLRRWNNDKKQCEKDAIAYEEAWNIAHDKEVAYDVDIEKDQDEIDLIEDNPIYYYDRDTIGSASVFLQYETVPLENGEARPFPAGLISLYTNALTDITDWNAVGKKGDLEGKYAFSLFTFTVDNAGHILYLKIFGEDQEKAVAMLDEILAQLDEYSKTLDKETRSAYTVSEVNKLGKTGKDDTFNAIQDTLKNRARDLRNDIVNLNNVKGEIEYPSEPPTMPSTFDVIKSFIKFFGFGFVAGAGALIALYYILFYLNGKVNSEDEFEFYTGIGAMAYDSRKKGGIDRLIAKKETRGLLYAQDDAVIRTLSNIKMSNPEAVKIMFTGIDSDKQVNAIKKSLEKAANLGLQFGLEKNILSNKEAYDHLKFYDAVVLVEKLDKVSSTVIKKEIEQIEIAGKKVVGTLVIR